LENQFTHILFDLDQTLWDFRKNAKEVIKRLFVELELEKHGVSTFEDFILEYKVINSGLWDDYRIGKITKLDLNNGRFVNTLKKFLSNNDAEEIGLKMADLYLKYSPENVTLFDGAEDVLKYLYDKYELHIISNGFSEIQIPKLKNSGLEKYFKEVILSEDIGCLKPDIRFFEYTLTKTGANKDNCIVVGDDPDSDIFGASNAGIKQIWFKHPVHDGIVDLEATHVINSLVELKELL
jgi:putative hydrolase of the HAD superfamily